MAQRKKAAPAQPAHADRHHDICSPSTLARRAACPGSAAAEAGLPDEPSKYAEEGTRQHELLELLLTFHKNGTKFDDVLKSCSTDREIIAEIELLLEQIGIDWETDTVHTERRVNLAHLGIEEGGVCDIIVVHPDNLIEVWDYKSGRTPVSANNNLQLLAYLAGACLDLGGEPLRVGIIQRGIGATSCNVSAEELAEAEQRIASIVDAAMQPDAPRVAGDHCRYCKASGNCYAINNTRAELERIEPATIDETLAALDDAALADFASKLSAVTAWCERARQALDAQILAGREVSGYRVVSGRKTQKWRDGAQEDIIALCGEHQVDPLVLASPAQIIKQLPKSAQEQISQYIEVSIGEPYVKKG